MKPYQCFKITIEDDDGNSADGKVCTDMIAGGANTSYMTRIIQQDTHDMVVRLIQMIEWKKDRCRHLPVPRSSGSGS